MVENPKFCETLLDKNDYDFIRTLVQTQIEAQQNQSGLY